MRSEEDMRAILKQINATKKSILGFDKDEYAEFAHTLVCRGYSWDIMEHAWILNAISDALSWALQEESVIFEDDSNGSIIDLINEILKSTQSDCDLDTMIQFGKREE
jgi:hypothetical protein